MPKDPSSYKGQIYSMYSHAEWQVRHSGIEEKTELYKRIMDAFEVFLINLPREVVLESLLKMEKVLHRPFWFLTQFCFHTEKKKYSVLAETSGMKIESGWKCIVFFNYPALLLSRDAFTGLITHEIAHHFYKFKHLGGRIPDFKRKQMVYVGESTAEDFWVDSEMGFEWNMEEFLYCLEEEEKKPEIKKYLGKKKRKKKSS